MAFAKILVLSNEPEIIKYAINAKIIFTIAPAETIAILFKILALQKALSSSEN